MTDNPGQPAGLPPNERTACSRCGRVVTIYPPEDGLGPFLCGRCAGGPVTVQAPRKEHLMTTPAEVERLVLAAALAVAEGRVDDMAALLGGTRPESATLACLLLLNKVGRSVYGAEWKTWIQRTLIEGARSA